MSPEFWIYKLSVHMGRIPWHPIPRGCEILLVLQLFWWVLWGTWQEHCGLASKNCRTDNGWILTRELSSLSLKGFRDEEVTDVWCISAHFGVTLNGRENSYVVPTWCSQPFLLMGFNSTSMKLPTSRSACLLPHGPAAFWYFLTSLLRLPFTTKPHNCFHPYDMTLSVLSTRDPHFSG